MSILSDRDIWKYLDSGELVVNPCNDIDVQPASIDLHLDDDLKSITGSVIPFDDEDCYVLKPQEFILGCTSEYVEIPDNLSGRVEGRSSIGRLGITAHITAGYIDPGFKGQITLEINNVSDKDFILKKNMNICQIVFETLTSPCIRPYGSEDLGSKYQDSEGTIASRYEY